MKGVEVLRKRGTISKIEGIMINLIKMKNLMLIEVKNLRDMKKTNREEGKDITLEIEKEVAKGRGLEKE